MPSTAALLYKKGSDFAELKEFLNLTDGRRGMALFMSPWRKGRQAALQGHPQIIV
jgi:hypothetical protein